MNSLLIPVSLHFREIKQFRCLGVKLEISLLLFLEEVGSLAKYAIREFCISKFKLLYFTFPSFTQNLFSLMLLFLFSYLYLAEVLKAYNLPMDYFTLGTYKAKTTCPLTIVVHKASNCIAITRYVPAHGLYYTFILFHRQASRCKSCICNY